MQLIKLDSTTIGNEVKKTVNARDLHSFLEVGKDFSNWIKDRIDSFGFVENQDFVCSPILASEGRGGHNRKDYFLTLDMAKELSMVERNDKGKQARQYFIDCERKAKNPVAMLNDPATLKQLLLANLQTVEDQKIQIEQRDKLLAVTAPKAAVADRLTNSDGWFTLRDASKALKMPERKFIAELQLKRWLYRDMKGRLRGRAEVVPRYINHKVTPIPVDGEPDRVSLQAMITTEGLTKLARMFNTEIELQEAA